MTRQCRHLEIQRKNPVSVLHGLKSGAEVMVVPRNLTDSTTLTAASLMRSGVCGGGCLWKSMTISTVLLTLSSRLFFVHHAASCDSVPVGQLIVVLDEAQDCGVVIELHQLDGRLTTLRSSSVGERGRQVAAQPHLLFPVGQEVRNPLTDGAGYLQL